MNQWKSHSRVDANALKLWRRRTAFQGSKKKYSILQQTKFRECFWTRNPGCKTSSLSLWLVDLCPYHSLQMHCRSFVRGSFPDLGHVSSKIPSRHWTSLEMAMAFVCNEYYNAFHWAIFFHVPQYKGQLDNVGCIGCRIQRDGVILWFLNSRNDFSEDLFTHYTDKLFHYCRWQIVCVTLAAISLSFDMLCKKVAYWAMSSKIPRKFPFLVNPTDLLPSLNAKPRSAQKRIFT